MGLWAWLGEGVLLSAGMAAVWWPGRPKLEVELQLIGEQSRNIIKNNKYPYSLGLPKPAVCYVGLEGCR